MGCAPQACCPTEPSRGSALLQTAALCCALLRPLRPAAPSAPRCAPLRPAAPVWLGASGTRLLSTDVQLQAPQRASLGCAAAWLLCVL